MSGGLQGRNLISMLGYERTVGKGVEGWAYELGGNLAKLFAVSRALCCVALPRDHEVLQSAVR